MLQRHAIQKLRGNKSSPVLLADVMDGGYVRVIQGRGSLSFPPEPSQRLRVACDIFRQEFECDKAMKSCVFSFVDDTHPSAAELLGYTIVRDDLVDHETKHPSGSIHLTDGICASQRDAIITHYHVRSFPVGNSVARSHPTPASGFQETGGIQSL